MTFSLPQKIVRRLTWNRLLKVVTKSLTPIKLTGIFPTNKYIFYSVKINTLIYSIK